MSDSGWLDWVIAFAITIIPCGGSSDELDLTWRCRFSSR